MSNNPRTHLEEQISAAAPAALSAIEEAALLESVRARAAAKAVPSPFISSFASYNKSMISIALIFALLLGAGGTAAASDNARPGDLLFPVDRAIEDLRLTLAPDGQKQELRIKFASERLREFDEISGNDDDLEGALTEAEADIFTDETVVKLEAGDRTVTFVTDADTRSEIIDVIRDRYGFTAADIDAVLTVDTEDRESTPRDRNEEDSERLADALDALGDFIEDNRDAASTSPEALAALALIEERLLERSAFFPEELRVKIRDDRARYEVRGEDGERVRVEYKDGEVRVKTKEGDDDDRDDDDRDDDRDRGEDESLEIEADIFSDVTTVEVELNGKKTFFTTGADTREEVIDAVQARFPNLSESEIDAALDLEVEDRASREDDRAEDDEDDERDEDERELEIEAEVHSNSSSVEVELYGVKTRFSTTATTRAGIIDAIESRFSELSGSEIDAALELEFDDEREEDDEDEDEEDDDDSSGHGSGRDDDEDDE